MSQQNWNRLFLQWLEEASEKAVNNATGPMAGKLADIYLRAYASLESCPKQFQHPSQLKELRFVGDKICNMLTKKLQLYCASEGLAVPENPTTKVAVVFNDKENDDEEGGGATSKQRKTKAKPAKQFVPKHRSGGYAILLVLRDHEKSTHFHGQGLGKSDIIRNAESKEYCDSSFQADTNTGSYYSAWNSMGTLIKNELVFASSARNSHYLLTDVGRQVANKLNYAAKESLGIPASSDPIEPESSTTTADTASSSTTTSSTSTTPSNSHMTITWPAGSFKIKILLDNREVKSSTNRDYFSEELISNGFDVDVKTLPVGDVIWAAEHNETHQQAVLDFILERKRLDDLISSIKDGRFTEQKSRLHRSALSHIIYLVEEPEGMSAGEYQQHANTAMSMVIFDDLFLRRTTGPDDTVNYLTSVTKELQKKYHDCPLSIIYPQVQNYKQSIAKAREEQQQAEDSSSSSPQQLAIDYDTFNVSLSKTGMFTVRDIFIQMLMTINGVTWDKAVAIQSLYPTPHSLYDAYSSLSSPADKKNVLFEALKDNVARKCVGKTLSEKIYEQWGCPPSC